MHLKENLSVAEKGQAKTHNTTAKPTIQIQNPQSDRKNLQHKCTNLTTKVSFTTNVDETGVGVNVVLCLHSNDNVAIKLASYMG